MAIKDKPLGAHEYYENLRDVYTRNKELAQLDNDRLEGLINKKKEEIIPLLSLYKLPIVEYPEFKENRYINGRLLNAAMGLYQHKNNTPEVKGACFKLLILAKNQEKYYDNIQTINKAEKILALTFRQYTAILKTFYSEVHRQMILNGVGYVFQGTIGWVCINRVIVRDSNKKTIDFIATANKKKEVLAQGLRVYNKEEAEWCRQNNIEYDGVDCRVYKHDEFFYEIPLINSRCTNAISLVFTPADSRPNKYHGYSNDDLIKLADNDKEKILKLDVGLKTKLTLCLAVDKLLYTKYIRHEAQKTYRFRKNNRQG